MKSGNGFGGASVVRRWENREWASHPTLRGFGNCLMADRSHPIHKSGCPTGTT